MRLGARVRFTTAALAAVLALAAQKPASAACPPGRFKVALDVGHTLSQAGATSARGIPEFEYNRRLGQAIYAALGQAGTTAVLIGGAGTPLQLQERTRLAQATGANLFLSVHHDSVQPRYLATWTVGGQQRPYSDVFRGYSVFVSNENARAADSLKFASLLGEALRSAGFTPSLHHAEPIPGEGRPLLDARIGLYRFDKLLVLRTAAMPAVLLEAGIIVNRAEEEQLQSAAVLDRMVTAIVASVQRYCAAALMEGRR